MGIRAGGKRVVMGIRVDIERVAVRPSRTRILGIRPAVSRPTSARTIRRVSFVGVCMRPRRVGAATVTVSVVGS